MISRLFALFLFLGVLPFIIIIGIVILIEDGFPIFFEQKRVGVNCSFFRIIKFRTMKNDTPNVATHLLLNPEKYLLKFGKFLRQTSLDELPNLLNIINGDMKFIGPRPALFNQKDLMELRVLHGIESLKPGITGWAQVNGRDEISIEEKVKYEKEYLLKKSIKLDLLILFKTFQNIIGKKNIKH
jgi:O-antigen biosynthesis protein WbqP